VGTTALVLALIEDDAFGGVDLTLANPVKAIHQVSYDLTLAEPLEMADGRTATAMELQWELYGLSRKYAEDRGLDCLGDDTVGREVLRRWEGVLNGLEADPATVAGQVDWVAKLQLLEAFRARHGLGWKDHRLSAVDLQYHDLRPERSLFVRLATDHLVERDRILAAVSEPPRRTRAYFRGQCLRRWASQVASANWDSLVFDLGTDPLRRVPMMDPLRGTAEHTEELLEGSFSVAELLTRLSG
jgi:proteasome accessory factor A